LHLVPFVLCSSSQVMDHEQTTPGYSAVSLDRLWQSIQITVVLQKGYRSHLANSVMRVRNFCGSSVCSKMVRKFYEFHVFRKSQIDVHWTRWHTWTDAGMTASISVLYLDFLNITSNYLELVFTYKLWSISDSDKFSCIIKHNILIRPKSIQTIRKYINRVYINNKIWQTVPGIYYPR